jgi:hypothetical protein
VVLNENGVEVAKEGKFTLAARATAMFELNSKWPSTGKRRGMLALEFDGRRLLAAGFRASGFGFYSYPAVARGERSAERGISRVTAGGPWQSTAYFTNASTLAQSGALRLWPDTSRGLDHRLNRRIRPAGSSGRRAGLAGQAGVGSSPGLRLAREPVSQAGGRLSPASPIAYAHGTTQRYESALESVVGMNGRLAIPFDNRASSTTQIVLVNTNDEPTEIQTAIYDLAGRFPRFGETFKLAGKGQLDLNSAERWELGGQQGVLVFSSRHSYRLSGIGLRFGDGPVAILPAFEK